MMGASGLSRQTPPNLAFDVWGQVHPDVRHNPRLRFFSDLMVEASAEMEDVMQRQGVDVSGGGRRGWDAEPRKSVPTFPADVPDFGINI